MSTDAIVLLKDEHKTIRKDLEYVFTEVTETDRRYLAVRGYLSYPNLGRGTIEANDWKATLWRVQGWVVEHPNQASAKALAFALNSATFQASFSELPTNLLALYFLAGVVAWSVLNDPLAQPTALHYTRKNGLSVSRWAQQGSPNTCQLQPANR